MSGKQISIVAQDFLCQSAPRFRKRKLCDACPEQVERASGLTYRRGLYD